MQSTIRSPQAWLTAYEEPIASDTDEDVRSKITQARTAQMAWAKKSVAQRGRLVVRLGEELAKHQAALAQLISEETGKPEAEAVLHELLGPAVLARHFGLRAPRVLKPKSLRPGLFFYRKSTLHYLPRGLIGVISPWNFPFALPFGDIAMALAAGNAIVLKPALETPRCALAIRWLLYQAGIDPELLQVCPGGPQVGQALLRGDIDMVRFTGSSATGQFIAQTCGEKLIPCVLELGGKDPAIVMEDADLDATADALVTGAFANAGQICASVERAYVAESIFDSLLERVLARTRSLQLAGPQTSNTSYDIGRMITPRQKEHVLAQLRRAKEQGAHLHCGGEARVDVLEPCVLSNCHDEMDICCEETFGPVLPLMRFKTVDEAIERANQSRYGLTAYVFGRDLQRMKDVALRLEAGSVVLNEVLLHHAAPEAPWGGVKKSGLGHTHGDEGLLSFCQIRHVNEPKIFTRPRSSPFGFSYSNLTSKPVSLLLRALLVTQSPLGKWRAWTSAVRALVALTSTKR